MKQFRFLPRVVLAACLLALALCTAIAPENALAAPPAKHGWVQVNASGFGDPANSIVGALAVYKGELYAGVTNYTAGGSVWRYKGGQTWEEVRAPGTISTTANPAIISMIDFTDNQGRDMLYVGTGFSSLGTSSFRYQVWRFDGTTWSMVLEDVYPVHGFSAFAVFNGWLYVGVQTKFDASPAQGGRIMRTQTGNLNDWHTVVTDGTTDGVAHPDAYGITSLTVFGSNLYAAVADNTKGVQVWRSADGVTWTTVVNNGFGGGANSWDAGGLTVFQGNLYMGVRNSTGGKLYRTADGTTWNPITTNGFGNTKNIKIEGLAVFANFLYAKTYNDTSGMEVWVSDTGAAGAWTPDQTNGFGKAANINSLWNSAQAVYNGTLYIGTSNFDPGSGAQIYAVVNNLLFIPIIRR